MSLRIAADTHSFCIEELRVPKSGKKAGEPTWVRYRWPGTLEQSAVWLRDELARRGVDGGQDILAAVRESTEQVKAALADFANRTGDAA